MNLGPLVLSLVPSLFVLGIRVHGPNACAKTDSSWFSLRFFDWFTRRELSNFVLWNGL
jgi:hypothetical protein